jgi:hypothetical protein
MSDFIRVFDPKRKRYIRELVQILGYRYTAKGCSVALKRANGTVITLPRSRVKFDGGEAKCSGS